MHFAKSAIVALSAFAATIAAQASLQFTTFPPSTVSAGTTYPVTYETAEGKIDTPVTILLKKGASTNLQTVSTLTTTVTGGSFNFVPDKSLTDGSDYALEIQQSGSTPNYTPQFSVSGGTGTGSSTTSSSSMSGNSTSTTPSSTTVTTVPYPGGNTTTPQGSAGTVTSIATATATTTPTSSDSGSSSSASAAATTTALSSGAGAVVVSGGKTGSPLALIAAVVAGLVYLN